MEAGWPQPWLRFATARRSGRSPEPRKRKDPDEGLSIHPPHDGQKRVALSESAGAPHDRSRRALQSLAPAESSSTTSHTQFSVRALSEFRIPDLLNNNDRQAVQSRES